MRHIRIELSVILIAVAAALFAQNRGLDRSADSTARVPALESFHEVIYQIWHNAWPKKDTAMLRRLLPDVEKGISEVAAARLPGILRERKEAWEDSLRKLQDAGAEYREAADAGDDARLMAAAETLHSRFEMMMRSIRPVMRELEDFHSVLYKIYHYYMPENDMSKIRSSIGELQEAMNRLNSAEIPVSIRESQSRFETARAELARSVDVLESVVASKDETKIKDAANQMHTRYQTLQRLCE
jgi:hypothetical protein